MAVEAKTMVPTIIVGVGGTGKEVIYRIRRLIEDAYGSLKDFPIVSFLAIDTDKGYKVSEPEAAGSPLQDTENCLATVEGREVQVMLQALEDYPWINSWFPSELEKNITALTQGAGQIRACGRFAFFCNYSGINDKEGIKEKFGSALNRIKRHENMMLDRYNVKVTSNTVNVFVTGSLSGGTGSGMLIDLGYCIRKWLESENASTTAVVPMPNAFAGIEVGDRVLANGYAALMELSYFSDSKTEYVAQFGKSLNDEVRYSLAPFDFTYLVGTKNTSTDFKLSQIREMIAQNIFLDLTSDFAPHKRSIRDNIKGSWAQADPAGRGYPKNFMSFGLATIEIPVVQIRTALSNRLASDLVRWWLNDSVSLPPQMLDLVRDTILKPMRLTEKELITDLAAASDRPYVAIISDWINSIRNEISNDDWLQCTLQGANLIGSEKGKILRFVNHYLNPKVSEYRADHFREQGTDERNHGDYLQKMYSNRDEIIKQGCGALTQELYRIVEDRTQGPKFAKAFLNTVRQVLQNTADKFRQGAERQGTVEQNRQKQYEDALQDINAFKDKYGATKQANMEQYCETALTGLEGCLSATIQRHARSLGLKVIVRLQEHLDALELKFGRLETALRTALDDFDERAQKAADSADSLQINGIKLYDRQENNALYQDLIEQLAGADPGSLSRYEAGMNTICTQLSDDALKQISPFWKDNRRADEFMQLLDLSVVPAVREPDVRDTLYRLTEGVIVNAPEGCKFKQDLAACDRLFATYTDNSEIVDNLRIAYEKSSSLLLLNRGDLAAAGFAPQRNINVAVLGGEKTSDPAAQKMLPLLKQLQGITDDTIKPLGDPERYRIVFFQEMGGFSLRCIDGMRELRQSYQTWLGESIEAKRARLRGESRDLPIPVHLQKEPPFWDIFPEDNNIYKLVVQARALGILRLTENKATGEHNVRYIQDTVTGSETVDVASSWEEAPRILEVKACRSDLEEIQRQVTEQLEAAKTEEQKRDLYNLLMQYLKQRSLDLATVGATDSPVYKRERTIMSEVITNYKLKVSGCIPFDANEETESAAPDQSPEVQSVPPVAAEQGVASPPPSSPEPTDDDFAKLQQELAKIKQLVDRGLITQEDYEAKKRQLLGL